MGLFHRHRWEERSRHYVDPLGLSVQSGGWGQAKITLPADMYPEDVRECLSGVTVVELRCKSCGDLTTERILGEAL